MSSGYEDIHPRRVFLAGRQPEVGSSAQSLPGHANIEAQQMTSPRVDTIRCHDEGCAPGLSFHHQAHDPAVFEKWPVHVGAAVRCNAGRSLRCMEENLVQVSASLTPARNRQARDRGESPFGDVIPEMVPDSIERGASDRVSQTHSAENGHATRHQSFAARLFFRELPALEELHGKALASQQNCQRRSGNPTSSNQHVRHNLSK